MPEDFVPSTTMERAYAQARHWPADRAWRRAYVQMSAGQVSPGVGMYLCLLDHYARRDGIRELFETCEWLLARMEALKPAERLSMCRIVCHMIRSLKEDEFDVREARLKLILRIPLAVIMDAVAEQRLSCALTGLLEFSRVFEESVTLKQCSEFEGDFMGVALAIDRAIRAGNVRDKVKASETKTREEYDRERLEAISMTDAIKKKLKEQTPALWASSWQKKDAPDEPTETEVSQTMEPASEFKVVCEPDQRFAQSEPAVAQPLRDVSDVVPPLTRNSIEKLAKAKNEVASAMRVFGPRSSEVAHRLSDLIELTSERFPAVNVDAQIEQLKEIVTDEQVDLSPYLMRKILSTIGNTDERKHLLAVLSVIEKSILSRKEKQIGLDLSLGITLWRLVALWRETDTLIEGRAYCDLLLQRLARSRSLDDPIVRQVSSAVIFMANLKPKIGMPEDQSVGYHLKAIDESAEFAAMLTVLALDDYHAGRMHSVELILNELLCFYSDTVGDASRRVGEMLWLTQETSLNKMRSCTLALVRHSDKWASDEYLNVRLGAHVKRVLERIADAQYGNEILAALILTRRDAETYKSFDDRLEQLKHVLALRNHAVNCEREASEEWKWEFSNAKIKAKSQPKSKSVAILSRLEGLASKKDWKNFASVLKKGATLLNVDESIYRLAQIGLHAVCDGQLELGEDIIVLLGNHVSPSCIHVFNYLSEECARRHFDQKEYKQAAQQIERALSNKHQLGDFCNCLRLQLAEIHIAMGNLFEATALIYEAYSNIPDSEIGGAKQFLLERK